VVESTIYGCDYGCEYVEKEKIRETIEKKERNREAIKRIR
jgi:hypothetical protein